MVCFILIDTISNSGVYVDFKELAFSQCKNVVFIQDGVMILFSCRMSLKETLFPVYLITGFICYPPDEWLRGFLLSQQYK